MSLKDYANTSLNSAIYDATQWRTRADTAIMDFQQRFIQDMERHVDHFNSNVAPGKNGKHRLTAENPSNYINSIPSLRIRYDRKDSYHNNRPHFQTTLASDDTYKYYLIWVNNDEEAEYCMSKIISFLKNEGLTIIECHHLTSGIIFKGKEGGYIIRYYLEW